MTGESCGHSKQPEAAAKDSTDPFSSLALATIELFEPAVSSSFLADPDSAIVSPSLEHLLEQMDRSRLVELKLVEVTRFADTHSPPGVDVREPFALLFCGSHQQPLISAIYTISHPDLADLNLFLSPVQVSLEYRPEEHPDGLFYETCFT